jgi:hypothetical protein
MHNECASTEEVRLICETSTEASQKSLTLLRAIDLTIDALVWIETQSAPTVAFIEKVTTGIKVCNRTCKVDPKDVVTSAVLTAEETSVALYDVLLKKRAFAIAARELDGDNKEAVVEAYNHAIAAVADLHNAFAELRWAIGEHDADLEEPTGNALSTSAEIAEYLDAL